MNREEFNVFINSEIDNLRSEIQRPGWTNWALIGALAALTWILIALVEEDTYSLKAVASLLLIIWFFQYSYVFIKGCISTSPTSYSNRGRFMPAHIAGANIMGIILGLAQLVFLTLVIYQFSNELGKVATNISYAGISILLFSAIGAFIITLTRLPLPMNTRNRVTIILPIISSILMLISIWYHIHFLWISPGVVTIYDVRFALVIAAIYFVLSKLISVPQGIITLNVLTTIRREFLFGQIELTTAIQQSDIALAGMRASDLLGDYVARLLSLYRDASSEFNKSMLLIDQLEKLLPETKESLLPEQLTFIDKLMDDLSSSIHKAHNIIIVDVPRAYKPLNRRMIPFINFMKGSNDFQILDQKLKDTQDNIGKQVDEFLIRYEKFMELFKIKKIS